jgi:protease-4
MIPNFGPLMRRYGLREEVVAIDEAAGFGALSHEMTDAERERLQNYMNDIYGRFVELVARSRQTTSDQVLAIAGGRVWSGTQAKELGLVDQLGGLQQAVLAAASEASLGEKYKVTHQPQPRSVFDLLGPDLFAMRSLVRGIEPASWLQPAASIEPLLWMVRDLLDPLSAGHARAWAILPVGLRVR